MQPNFFDGRIDKLNFCLVHFAISMSSSPVFLVPRRTHSRATRFFCSHVRRHRREGIIMAWCVSWCFTETRQRVLDTTVNVHNTAAEQTRF